MYLTTLDLNKFIFSQKAQEEIKYLRFYSKNFYIKLSKYLNTKVLTPEPIYDRFSPTPGEEDDYNWIEASITNTKIYYPRSSDQKGWWNYKQGRLGNMYIKNQKIICLNLL